ncbi:hypothetical protein E2C01_048937 [Portunus trituberculatus]|uniref:Uncharacterized protein n=1 Tax=Portunus trituberculatus TaxID=210409 RepID=A0A5B7GBV4_PORTR|nr:hypothetical protein [Portunus trituberculatus]
MFETVKAHPTFNYRKVVYSQDLYEFSEEEILVMCPSSVHRLTKMRNSSNMALLTFFASTLPDRVYIGPINLRMRRFVSRPLHCFSCYGYGHGKSYYEDASRCCNCSALDLHSEEHCNAAAYCFHCRDAHQSLTQRHRGSAESMDLAQVKQSKISSGAHDCKSFWGRSAMVAPMVSFQSPVTPSISDRASCGEDALTMESFDDIVIAVPRGPTVAKSAVRPVPCPRVPSRNSDDSHHSPVGRKAGVHQSDTS